MTAEHTEGVWIARDSAGRYLKDHSWWAENESSSCSASAPIHVAGSVVALVVTDGLDTAEMNANAQRIVSCVNALDGLPQETLDGGWTAKGASAYAKRLESINADLLEALETMVKRIEFYSAMGEAAQPNIEQWEYTEGSTDMANARAAIAKARGEA